MLVLSYEVLCMAIPCMIFEGILYKRQKARESRVGMHFFGVGVLLLYIFCAVLVAGIGSVWEIGSYGAILRLDEINVIPFRSVGWMTYLLNILMFIPLGFLVPLIWKDYRSAKDMMKLGILCSLSIECCQLFNHRVTDIDDLMMNTLGTLVGYSIWYLSRKLFLKLDSKICGLSKWEPLGLFLIAVLGEFLLFNWKLVV